MTSDVFHLSGNKLSSVNFKLFSQQGMIVRYSSITYLSRLWTWTQFFLSNKSLLDICLLNITEGEFDSKIGREGTELGQFKCPEDVSVSRDGRVYVTDCSNHRIQILR